MDDFLIFKSNNILYSIKKEYGGAIYYNSGKINLILYLKNIYYLGNNNLTFYNSTFINNLA